MGADAGLHILRGDGERRDQSELINLARVHDVRVYGTNRYWVENARPMRNFVPVGFSQIREEDPRRDTAPRGGLVRLTCNGAAAARGHAPVKTRAPQHPEGGGTLGRRERELVFTN